MELTPEAIKDQPMGITTTRAVVIALSVAAGAAAIGWAYSMPRELESPGVTTTDLTDLISIKSVSVQLSLHTTCDYVFSVVVESAFEEPIIQVEGVLYLNDIYGTPCAALPITFDVSNSRLMRPGHEATGSARVVAGRHLGAAGDLDLSCWFVEKDKWSSPLAPIEAHQSSVMITQVRTLGGQRFTDDA